MRINGIREHDIALTQGSPEWLAMRKRYIGASDAPIIMGVSPWSTRNKLWRNKVGLGEQKTNAAMIRGTNMESAARYKFIQDTGILVSPKVVFSKDYDFMMASLDGINANGDVVVEIKCPGVKDHAIAKSGEVPDKYIPQLQHQMSCANVDKMFYYSFDGHVGVVVDVARDDKYLKKLHAAEAAFWQYVLDFEEPPLEDRDYHQMESLEWKAAALEYKSLQAQLDVLEKRSKIVKDSLIEMSGGVNSVGSGIKLTKSTRRGAVDYANIPALQGVETNSFRKNPVEFYRISCL